MAGWRAPSLFRKNLAQGVDRPSGIQAVWRHQPDRNTSQEDTMPALIEGRIGALDRIGRKVNTESAEEALLRGGLANWNVRKQRMRTSSNVTVPNKYAVVRDNPETGKVEYMSVVGTRYQITQNEEHIDFLQAPVDESHSTFTTAADLNNGNLVYIQMRLPEGIMIGGRDPVDMYLTGINSFDGKTPFMVGL